jgi:hypothetical protein
MQNRLDRFQRLARAARLQQEVSGAGGEHLPSGPVPELSSIAGSARRCD